MEFSGHLTSMNLSDVLQWASNNRRTGSLVVRTSNRQKHVFFEHGQIVGCYSDDPNEYFGQFLLLYGFLETDQLREALSHCRLQNLRLGEILVSLDMVDEATVKEALRTQIFDVVCDLFLWTNGLFYFENQLPDTGALSPDPIDPMVLALEGSRWADEEDRIRSVFVHDNIVLRKGPEWESGGTSSLEQRILERFTDPLAVHDLYPRVKGTHFRFLEALFRMTLRGVLDIESVGEEWTSGASREIRIFDLLLEQAEAEEQVIFSQSHLSLPLDILQRFYPLWIEPEGDPALPGGGLEQSFIDSMDGSRSLHELVFEAGDERETRMELILLELRRGHLALLPRPLSEFRGVVGRRPWLRRLFGT